MRLNVHLHVLALDGVYVRDTRSGKLVFEALGAPSQAEVLEVARCSAERIDTLLRENGRSLEREGEEPELDLVLDESGLAACYAAAAQGLGVSGERAGQPALRLVFGQPASADAARPSASEPAHFSGPGSWRSRATGKGYTAACRFPATDVDPDPKGAVRHRQPPVRHIGTPVRHTGIPVRHTGKAGQQRGHRAATRGSPGETRGGAVA